MHPCHSCDPTLSRRDFFSRMTQGVTGAALAGVLLQDFFGARNLMAAPPGPRVFDLKAKPTHFEPKAKAVIQLFMNGGPSQMDMFDPKPALDKHHGEPFLDKLSVTDVQDPEQAGALMRSPFKFAQHGESGIWLSDVLPHLAEVVDEIALIRSMWATSPSHPTAVNEIHCGRTLPNLATMGSWVVYGLGAENQDLPAYVVLDDPDGLPVTGAGAWQSGYLPPIYQGTRLRCEGSPIINLQPEEEESSEFEQIGRDLLGRLDRIHQRDRPHQPRLEARISSYELAARLQLEATDVLDISRESPETLAMYGVGDTSPYEGRLHPISGPDSYARRCIMARRLVERGVRIVQIYINSQLWDMHSHIENEMRAACAKTDKPVAALLKDLKQRGLLDSTLVVWGGEFGRMPMAQFQTGIAAAGRDHNPHGFTTWMAGGGIKGGTVHGATDEFGLYAVEDRVSIADWHATILHQLGLHHEDLYFERSGFKERLTFTHKPRVIKEILA